MILLFALDDAVEQEKLVQIFDRYKREIFIIAYDILKDYHEAEDALQNVILKISKHLDGIQDVTSNKTRSFIFQITKNHCFDVYNKRAKMDLNADVSDLEAEDIFTYDAVLDEQVFLSLLSDLKHSHAEMLSLRYYHELSISEIASLLDISENNVSTRLNRAHKAVKSKLNERSN